MKIGSPADKPPVGPVATGRASTTGEAAAKTAVPAASEAASGPSAQVELSTTATSLLSGIGASSPEFDADKVARVSQAIADGSFKIDHAAIADKLIANAKELLSKASH